ncbi:MAG TPA: response regulator [Thermoanaerobaculia bacterium]|jgi:CheY-like chemotaxis protein|nr:response regulator [Thermoanaerobaculia bacterium]
MSAKRILVTDDDPSILRLLSVILRRANYHVDTASSGPEAIAKAEETRYDAMVLDLMMPAMDGVEVLSRLSARPHKPKFVVIMSAAPPDTIMQAITPHVFATLQKPCGINDIVATVGACIAAPGAVP